MSDHRSPLLRRLAGYAIIGGLWGALAVTVFFFAAVYAIYADMQASDRSRWTEGTGAEYVGGAIYDRFRSPWKTEPDDELVYVPKIGAARMRSPEYDTTITIASDGSRQQPEFPADQANGDLVVIAGDSFALGLGVGDTETYSAVLQRRFHHRTVNTGVISYGTARELWRLRRLGLLEKATVVVIQFCSNDGRENSDFLAAPTGRFGRPEAGGSWAVVQNPYYPEFSYGSVLAASVAFVKQAVHGSGLRGAARLLWKSRRTTPGTALPTRDRRSGEQLARDFLGVLDQFPELAGKRVLVTELNDRGGITGFLPALGRATAGRANFGVVPVALGVEDYFRFDGHLVPRGHEKVAAAIDRAIREQRASAGKIP